MTRPRRSAGLPVILSRRWRCNGLIAAVSVVRSIPSSVATADMPAGSGRFKDIISENCPLVIPSGRNASSKRRASALAARCTWRHRQASRTSRVVSKLGFVTFRISK